jgi:hypothetical protein
VSLFAQAAFGPWAVCNGSYSSAVEKNLSTLPISWHRSGCDPRFFKFFSSFDK